MSFVSLQRARWWLQAYRAALKRYDLQTAYLLISVSQKDPAEHLLELQGFYEIGNEALQRHAQRMSWWCKCQRRQGRGNL